MRIAIAGHRGPVALATLALLKSQGHTLAEVSETELDAVIYFPGFQTDTSPASVTELKQIAARADVGRLVLRSHGYAYGSNAKNPGFLEEDRISLLDPHDPAQQWLRAEEAASTHTSWAALRLASVTDPAEGDLIVKKLNSGIAVTIAGRDPNLQFLTVADAARALVAAAESNATGIFNVAGTGSVPREKAFKAAGTSQIRVPAGDGLDQLAHNWTMALERTERELGFRPSSTSVEALRDFLKEKHGARPEKLAERYDDWGLDVDYIKAWGWWFAFLRNIYWRIESEGMENIPAEGKHLFVSNHRGFMPLDAVMHLSLIFTHRVRVPRFLIISSLLRTPYMSIFLSKLGGVVACQENAKRLFDQGELVGIFPEGIRGTFSPYKTTYKLRNFSKSGFTRMAVENQAPIIPSAVIGHAEIFPIIGRIDSSLVVKELGWPYLPIAPLFPLAPVPIPSKWHVRILPAVPLEGLKPADAENDRLMKSYSDHIQHIVQTNIDDMLPRRRSIFFGKEVLNGVTPAAPPFEPRTLEPRRRSASAT